MHTLYNSEAFKVERLNFITTLLIDKHENNIIVMDEDTTEIMEYEAFIANGYSDVLCSCVAKMVGQ